MEKITHVSANYKEIVCKTCKKVFSAYSYASKPKLFCSKTCARLDQKHGYALDFLDDVTAEIYGYFLGFWVTDGNMSIQNINKAHVVLNSTDLQIIEDVAKKTNYKNKITERLAKNSINTKGLPIISKRNCYSISYGLPIAKKLLDIGYTYGAKTGKEFIPDTINENTFSHFLRGVIDGDGWITYKTGTTQLSIGIISASKLFITQLFESIKKYTGISGGNITIKDFKNNINMPTYILRYGHNDSYTLGEYIYNNATIFLKRKFDKFLIGKQNEKTILQKELICNEELCDLPAHCKGLCHKHYHRYYHREYKQGLRRKNTCNQ